MPEEQRGTDRSIPSTEREHCSPPHPRRAELHRQESGAAHGGMVSVGQVQAMA